MRPRGYIDDLTRFRVDGWAADLDDVNNPLAFGVYVDGNGCGELAADQYRPGLEQAAPGANGRHAFSFYFPAPLSPYRRHMVELRCITTDLVLRQELPPLHPVAMPRADDLYRPHGPILVTSGGRSGSTAIMEALRTHPRVVVAGKPPYEVEMGCYYAHALRALTATADHARSLAPDRVTDMAHYYRLGFNPYLEVFSFGSWPALREFVSDNVAGRVGGAFRGIILDYYQGVARQQDKRMPAAFAEKTLPEPDSRFGIRHMFGNTREIVLVRDPRDVVASFMQHGHVPFEEALSDAASTTRRFLEIKAAADESVLFLRYEDFVLQPRETVAALFRFVGLAPVAYDEAEMGRLFGRHGTSRTPVESIGRWRRELTSQQQARFAAFAPALGGLGYAME